MQGNGLDPKEVLTCRDTFGYHEGVFAAIGIDDVRCPGLRAGIQESATSVMTDEHAMLPDTLQKSDHSHRA